jgi:hypothetical protein
MNDYLFGKCSVAEAEDGVFSCRGPHALALPQEAVAAQSWNS